MALVSGLSGYVNKDGVAGTFGKWRLRTKTVKPSVNSFRSQYQRKVSGLIGAELTIEGPWDVGALGITAGGSYAFRLGVTASVYLDVTAIVDFDASNDVEDAPRITVTGESDGPFSITAA